MPSQLLNRLDRFLDQDIAADVMALEPLPRNDVLGPPPLQDPTKPGKPAANTRAHWPARSWGDEITTVQSVVIHETSGWPSYQSAYNFFDLYRCLNELAWKEPSGGHPGFWMHRRGYGPQYFVDPNGTAYTLIGPPNLAGRPRATSHAVSMNFFSLGIENGNAGDASVDPGAGNGPRWWSLSTEPEDLTGMKAYLLLHPRNAEDAGLIWFARFPNYTGPGDLGNMPQRYTNWRNMLFTERNYRSLALLCRLLAEQMEIPRNFLLLPYVIVELDNADAALFRKLLLADPLHEPIARKLALPLPTVQAGGTAFAAAYAPHHALLWSRLFGRDPNHPNADATHPGGADPPCFRGFMGHSVNGHHHCPGPLFDWHRLAREVWDWWWYPFDFELVSPASVSTTLRPYRQARGDTPVVEYYYDAAGTARDYEQLKPPLSIAERFTLPEFAPAYALANGVAVAARMALSNSPVDSGFLLVRHAVFHRASIDRIDYDLAPTYVWSLISFLSNPGFSIDRTVAVNPDWLNRFVMRLKETELAVDFHAAPPAPSLPALTRAWARVPTGAGPRLATGADIERDATVYRVIADELVAGRPVLFPIEAQPAATAVRVLLGDFLGNPNRLPSGTNGIEIEIFSRTRLDVPGVTNRAVSAVGEDWWRRACAATRHEASADADLPLDGMVWHYPMTSFLSWLNAITWASEWPKYGALDAAGQPVPLPNRPPARTGL